MISGDILLKQSREEGPPCLVCRRIWIIYPAIGTAKRSAPVSVGSVAYAAAPRARTASEMVAGVPTKAAVLGALALPPMRRRRRPTAAMASAKHQIRRLFSSGLFAISWCLLWSSIPAAANDAGTAIIALTIPESNATSGYFPLSKALRSIMRLAAADINGGGLAAAAETPVEGNLTLSVVEVATGSRAIEGLCEALSSVGENGTFGVSRNQLGWVFVREVHSLPLASKVD